MLRKKMIRTMKLYKAQFISMIIMIAIGIGVFVGFNMEWYSIKDNMDYAYNDTNFADYRVYNQEMITGKGFNLGFSKDDADKVAKISGVDRVSRFLMVNADVKNADGDGVNLIVTENNEVSNFSIIGEGRAYSSDDTDGIWVGDKYANANGISVGDKMTLVYNNIELTGTVAGLVKSSEQLLCTRDETQLMPDYDTFGFVYISPAMYKKVAGFEIYPQLNVISSLDEKNFKCAVNEALGKTMMVLTKDEVMSYAGPKGEMEEGQTMGAILPVLFLLIAMLTMVTTMHRLTAKEKVQIGTFKALGLKDRRIIVHYTSYAFVIGIVGSVIGIGLGFAIGYSVMNPSGMMGTYLDFPRWRLVVPGFCWVVLIAINAFMTLVGYLSVRKMLKGTPADALRPYSPKKIKRLILEKTPLWNKLSFGTKWNLRDVMRHKSRSFMTLFGIVGCMMIIIASFGIKDTLDNYLDVYYNQASNYNSCIYLSENATDEQKQAIVDEYQGDYCASISVELEDKAVALDIYEVDNDLVRFLDKDQKITGLGTDGAYICSRIAKKYGLEVGDTFTISPFGQEKKYELKVNKIMASMSENIVILPEYAKTLGIDYSITSIFTNTDKEDIKLDDSIKSVQSKQAILDSFDKFMEIMNLMIVILVVAAGVLGVIVLYNLGIMSYTERYREMATLKVVGFKDAKIASLLIGQNMWLSVVGIILGIPAGLAALEYLVIALATEYELKVMIYPLTYIISIVLTLGVSLVVSVLVSKKNKHIDMVEALKGNE